MEKEKYSGNYVQMVEGRKKSAEWCAKILK